MLLSILKALSLILILATSFAAQAVTVSVTDQKAQLIFEINVPAALPDHVGNLTVDAFEKGELPFEGGNYGIKKITDLAQEIEVVSDTEMKAWGWCFSLDGLVPETMADQTQVTNSISVIEWFYAYAHFKDGAWIGQCVRPRK